MAIALVTGCSRGLGFAIASELLRLGHSVVGTTRSIEGFESLKRLELSSNHLEIVELDVTCKNSIRRLKDVVDRKFGSLDILINNAAILNDKKTLPSEVDEQELESSFKTNFLGPFLMIREFLPMLRKSKAGRIVNVSSSLIYTKYSFAAKGFCGLGYIASKSAMHSLTTVFAKEVRFSNVRINSVCPGWLRTDMGGPHAPLTAEQGADTPIWLATMDDECPNGGFFINRQCIDGPLFL